VISDFWAFRTFEKSSSKGGKGVTPPEKAHQKGVGGINPP